MDTGRLRDIAWWALLNNARSNKISIKERRGRRRPNPASGIRTGRPMKEIVIPKEEAVFWLDRQGYWRNRHGRFERPRIIAKFHGAIGRDEEGYYLSQVNGEVLEKVYFPYEDTALFVFDVIIGARESTLVLNTGHQIPLVPDRLYIQDDALYIESAGERIRFAERALLKLSPLLEDQGASCAIRVAGHRLIIPERAKPERKQDENETIPKIP